MVYTILVYILNFKYYMNLVSFKIKLWLDLWMEYSIVFRANCQHGDFSNIDSPLLGFTKFKNTYLGIFLIFVIYFEFKICQMYSIYQLFKELSVIPSPPWRSYHRQQRTRELIFIFMNYFSRRCSLHTLA